MSRRALRESERVQAQATLPREVDEDSGETGSDQRIRVQPAAAEPLHYVTQARQPSSGIENQPRRPRPRAVVPPASETPQYRLRDFSPESRGNSFTSTGPVPRTGPPSGGGDLNYHTSAGAESQASVAFSPASGAPPKLGTRAAPLTGESASARAGATVSAEHTLTRRELRALRDAALSPTIEAAPQERVVVPNAPEPVATGTPAAEAAPIPRTSPEAPAPLVQPLPRSAPSPASGAELAAAMAEFDALYRAQYSTAASAPPPAPVVAPTPVVSAEPVAQAQPEPFVPVAPPSAVTPVAPVAEPVTPEPLRDVVTAPEVYGEPAVHWSAQTVLDDQSQAAEQPFRRDLAASDAVTTNALVLPNFPQAGSFTAPLSSTGEILVTGTIDLPRSLGLSGMDRSRYDQADIDFADGFDREDAAPDSAPVRAIRAVSTHTSSQGIISTKRPKGNNLPVILSIAAGVMAVGVVVLFVAAMVFKIF